MEGRQYAAVTVPKAIADLAAMLRLMLLSAVWLGVADAQRPPASSPARDENPGYILENVSLGSGVELDALTAILQSQDGYIWISSYSGLVRFDGVQTTVFNTGNTGRLASNRLTALCEDDHGVLWIGHETGALTRYDHGRFEPVPLLFPWPGRQICSLGVDPAGDLWLASARCGLFRLRDGFCARPEVPAKWWPAQLVRGPDRRLWAQSNGQVGTLGPEGFRPFRFGPQDKEDQECLSLLPARDGGLWAVRTAEIGKWRDGNWQAGPVRPPWTNDNPTSLAETADGGLLVGTWLSGLYLFDGQMRAQHFSRATGLPNDAVGCLWRDREGNLWIGTSSSLSLLLRRNVEMLAPPNEFLGRKVLSICALPDGSAWIGTQGAGLYHYQPGGNTPRWEDSLGAADLPARFIWSLLPARNGELWIGAWGWGLFVRGPQGFRGIGSPEHAGSGISAIFQDRDADLWVGTTVGLYRYHQGRPDWFWGREELGVPDVRCIAQTPDGALWAGTYGGGLARIADQKATRYGKAQGLESDFVAALYAETDGALWVGTADRGLCRMKEGRFTTFGPQQGLPAPGVFHILDDGAGFLWLGTDQGVFRAAKVSLDQCASGAARTISCLGYGKPEGLASEACSGGFQPGAARAADGRLWFPTAKGVAIIDPSRVRTNTVAPPVVIEDLLVDGKPAGPIERAGHLRIKPGKHRFEFRYAGLSFTSPQRVRFRYRLEGQDQEDWVEAGPQRAATYTYLKPGAYRFHVIACNNHGVWNTDGASLAFTVLPHFWQTWWFIGASALGGAGLFAGIVFSLARRRLHRRLEQVERQRAVERERTRIARDIHDDLGASLTRIVMLSESVSKECAGSAAAVAAAGRVNATARELTLSMDEIVWAVNPKHDTLDSLANYLGGFAQDYLQAAGLRCRLDVPLRLPTVPLTAEVRHSLFLAFKEALHNVVKHARATQAEISLGLEPGGFFITVSDDGRGIQQEPELPNGKPPSAPRVARGNGLANMRKRMADLGGSCHWESPPGQGTRVTFRLKADAGAKFVIKTDDGLPEPGRVD